MLRGFPMALHRLAGFAGRGCTANIDVATTHDFYPLLRKGSQRTSTRKVARRSSESAGPRLRFIQSASERGRTHPRKDGKSGPNGRFSGFSLILSTEGVAAEFIEFFRLLFRPKGPTKQFPRATKPFSVFGADVRKQPTVIRFPTRRQALPATDNRRQVRCGPPASSSPSPSSWLVPRWLVLPTSTCRASVPLPIMARR